MEKKIRLKNIRESICEGEDHIVYGGGLGRRSNWDRLGQGAGEMLHAMLCHRDIKGHYI